MVMKRYFLCTQEKLRFSITTLLLCALVSPLSFALQESTGPNGSNVQAVHDLGYTGEGISVGLISQDHARYTHEAFFDKDGEGMPTGTSHANYYNATDEDPTLYVPISHDTSVGGIICSRGGASYPNDKGAAPAAELYSFRVTRNASETDPNKVIAPVWVQEALDQALDDGCQIIVTGIQLGGATDGNSIWSLIYDYYAYEYNLVFATAAGNYASSVTVFGDTYNSITTGGLIGTATDLYGRVGSGSNPGPTSDGRQKPDIAAPSQNQWVPINGDISWRNEGTTAGQTSWSVPHTGGVAAVLLSYANSPESPEANDNQNEVIKAVIVNSTFPNIQDEYGTATTGQVWNKYRGYGRIDAKRTYDILSSPKITPSSSTENSKGWAYDTVASGQQDSYTVQGIKNERLVVTLTWNRRIIWNDQNSPQNLGHGIIEDGELEASLADLDLEIYDPDDYDNAITTKFSAIDNLEKFDLLLTKTGDYLIKVVNQSGNESADYAIAFELLEPLEADYNTDYVVNGLDFSKLSAEWLNTLNLNDLLILAQEWLTYDPKYYSP
ncbi:MAG: hypothetical protein DRP56_01965 [Planctomycetota bacterium]|nr:MAG: hypothetical protein DRP56_01965 [Planctomycetota bacterium]